MSIVIIGAGASGMMAAVCLLQQGYKVIIIDKNHKAGRKMFISGKGRCNLCNMSPHDVVFSNVVRNSKFFYGSYYQFTNQDVFQFFEQLNVPLKIERGNRVFPVSDRASDVIDSLYHRIKQLGGRFIFEKKVIKIKEYKKVVQGVYLNDNTYLPADIVIMCSGGMTYPHTGTDGTSYLLVTRLGHSLIEPFPALVPIITKEKWTNMLQGLSLKNVSVKVKNDQDRVIFEELGEMMFTHFGALSGPLMLSLSSYVTRKIHIEHQTFDLYLDVKPGLSLDKVIQKIESKKMESKDRNIDNMMRFLLPERLIAFILKLAGISSDRKAKTLTTNEIKELAKTIKAIHFTLTDTLGPTHAVITSGGIHTKEINPKTMESKFIKNLYFAGEVIDLDALTGGFNFQIAFSTAYAAAHGISTKGD